jgi:hypothetical protein
MKLYNFFNFFPCKKALYVKRQDFFQNVVEKCAFYGLGSRIGTVNCQKSESEPKPYPNLSKVRKPMILHLVNADFKYLIGLKG